MPASLSKQLVHTYPLISDQITVDELIVILRELEIVLHKNVIGDVVEFGCYTGTTSLFLQRLLQVMAPQTQLHVYDSFEGLPPKTAPDQSPVGQQFVAGELKAGKHELVRNFKKAGLPVPVIHKAWFTTLSAHDLPHQICFAFLDGDFYHSIMDSLRLIWPKLAAGAVVLVDDYNSEALPGVAVAVNEWVRQHPVKLANQASLAIIKKR